MKTTKILIAAGISGLTTLTLLAGPPVVVIQAPAPPSVVISPPAVVVAPAPVVVPPAPTVVVETVPDTYVWDGVEFVGVVGPDYFYLGPDHVWLRLDDSRAVRFHDWEHGHANWRDHAIHNELYRHNGPGHDVHPDASRHDNDHHDADRHDGDRHDRH